MRDLQSIRDINANPEAYRKPQEKIELANEIFNLESRLRILKAKQEEADDRRTVEAISQD